jgi:putative hydrolase of the HAD superfamily
MNTENNSLQKYNPARVKAVVFDLGGVLIDVNRNRAHRKWRKLSGLDEKAFDRVFFGGRLKNGFNTGEVSEPEFLETVAQRTADLQAEKNISETSGPPTARFSPKELRRVWCALLTPSPPASAVVAALNPRLHRAVLSDTDPIHARHMVEHFSFMGKLTPKVFSYEVKTIKPDPRIYRVLLERLDLEPSACLFLDDKSKNVIGAHRAGLQAVQVTAFSLLPTLLRPLFAKTSQ